MLSVLKDSLNPSIELLPGDVKKTENVLVLCLLFFTYLCIPLANNPYIA